MKPIINADPTIRMETTGGGLDIKEFMTPDEALSRFPDQLGPFQDVMDRARNEGCLMSVHYQTAPSSDDKLAQIKGIKLQEPTRASADSAQAEGGETAADAASGIVGAPVALPAPEIHIHVHTQAAGEAIGNSRYGSKK